MNSQRGFTLIELAIVLVIVTILIGGLAVPLSAQIEARRISETKKTLEEAREAIFGYAMTHIDTDVLTGDRPYLPCPDTNNPPDGQENRTGDVCDGAAGWLPWIDLGVASQDAWGNRLRYSVENREYAERSNGIPNLAVSTPVMSLKRVCTTSACTTLVADDLPVVIVAHGPNGWGARNVNGNLLSDPASNDEKENTDGDSDFVTRFPSKAGDAAGEFDDLVVWISDGVLRSRVCPAGGCP